MARADRTLDQAPSAAEFTALRAYLQARGVAVAQLARAVGAAVNGRTRREIAQALIAWLKDPR